MELVLIKQDSPEWEYMWGWLASHPVNQGLDEPKVAENEGEAWQYMGSYKNKNAVISEFRHRNHPVTGGLYKASVEHPFFDENSIDKSAKIR